MTDGDKQAAVMTKMRSTGGRIFLLLVVAVAGIIVLLFLLLNFLGNFEKTDADDPYGGVLYYFSSGDELDAVMPANAPIAHLEEKGFEIDECKGWFDEAHESISLDKRRWYSFIAYIDRISDGQSAIISCMLYRGRSAKYKAEHKLLTYSPETTRLALISEVSVYYAYDGGKAGKSAWSGYNAVFEVGDHLYEVSVPYCHSEEIFLSFLRDIIR